MRAWALLWLLVVAVAVAQEPDEYNVPTELGTCMRAVPQLRLSAAMNPFYLSADFNGDGRLDFAAQVVKSGQRGIVVCLTGRAKPLVVGAGSNLVWPASNPWRFNAWSVAPKGSRGMSWPKNARGDAIHLDVKEAADGLLYWDGRRLRWFQQAD